MITFSLFKDIRHLMPCFLKDAKLPRFSHSAKKVIGFSMELHDCENQGSIHWQSMPT